MGQDNETAEINGTGTAHTVKALRAVLYEYGHVFPAGIGQLKRIEALVEDPTCDLPVLITTECRDLLAQICGLIS